MARQVELSGIQRTAKQLWSRASQEIDPIAENAVDFAFASAKQAKRVAKNARTFVRKNPWTSAGIAALVAAAVITAVVQLKRQSRELEEDEGVES